MQGIIKLDNLEYDKLVQVDQFKIDQTDDRPEVDNKIRKLLFFIRAEGVARTLNKINSKRDKSVVFHRYNTTITVKYKDKLYVNYSVQTTKNSENFVITNVFFDLENMASSNYHVINSFNQFSSFTDDIENIKKTTQLPIKELPDLTTKDIIFNEGVFIYGLGDYARVYIAPNIKKLEKIFCVDYVSKLSIYYRNKYGYAYNGIVPEDSYQVLGKVTKPLAIIATYHSDHTRIAEEVFNINPNSLIFIEKPPCVVEKDIRALANLYKKGAQIEIGYNRRFIKINQKINQKLKGQKAIINISVKEILINENHWYFWKNQGTRITGNLTHWIDLCNYWLEDEIPVEITMLKSTTKDETFTTSILYSKGSLANFTVSDKGNPLRGVQEKIEIRTEKESYFIDDYLKSYIIDNNGRKRNYDSITRSKGHDAMYKHVVNLYQKKTESRYSVRDLIKTALTTYYMSEMFKNDTNHFKCEETIGSMLNEFDLKKID